MSKICVSFVLIPFVAFIIAALRKFEAFKEFVPYEARYGNCHYIDQKTNGPEDITRYNSNTLIFGSADFVHIVALGEPARAAPGGIYAIYNADVKDFQVKEVKVNGFPKKDTFNPHGIQVKTFNEVEYLYVINHGFHETGERIEVFKIKKDSQGYLELDYDFTIAFPHEYNGKFNDLVLLSPTHLVVSEWMIYPVNKKGGKEDGLLHQMKQLILQFSGFKWTNLQSCVFEPKSGSLVTPSCHPVEGGEGSFNNGVTTDGDHVYLADSISQTVTQFTITPTTDQKQHWKALQYKQTIQLPVGVDNIEYDPSTKKIYVQGIFKLAYFLTYFGSIQAQGGYIPHSEKIGFVTGSYEIDLTQPTLSAEPTLVAQDIAKGSSGFYTIGSNLFLGSIGDDALVVCNKK